MRGWLIYKRTLENALFFQLFPLVNGLGECHNWTLVAYYEIEDKKKWKENTLPLFDDGHIESNKRSFESPIETSSENLQE